MSNTWHISEIYDSHLFNILCHNSGLTLSEYFTFTNKILVTETRQVGHCARSGGYFSNCVMTIDCSITINLAVENNVGLI
jgi:hypothetical protein